MILPAFFILKKKIFEVSLHHEVLPGWEEWSRHAGHGLPVICLDFHNDVLDCRRRGIELPGNAAEAVEKLHHDEHFDWALRRGVLSESLIISWSECTVAPAHPALQVRHAQQMPEMSVMLNEPEKFRPVAEMVLEDRFLMQLLPEGIPSGDYILDIDCDCIMCEAALHPENGSFIDALAEHALGISLSHEDDWVKILRLPGENITGRSVAGELIRRWHGR